MMTRHLAQRKDCLHRPAQLTCQQTMIYVDNQNLQKQVLNVALFRLSASCFVILSILWDIFFVAGYRLGLENREPRPLDL